MASFAAMMQKFPHSARDDSPVLGVEKGTRPELETSTKLYLGRVTPGTLKPCLVVHRQAISRILNTPNKL